MIRETISAAIKNIAPITADTGISLWWRVPTSARAAWGITRPTKPIAPTRLTMTAVIKAQQVIKMPHTQRTGIPSDAAESVPKAKASSARAKNRQITKPIIVTGKAIDTSTQRTVDRLPINQNIMPRACSASAPRVTIKAVRALKNWAPAIPARITAAALRPMRKARRATQTKATKAPIKAPPDMEITPKPVPIIITQTAPVEAPAEIPNK